MLKKVVSCAALLLFCAAAALAADSQVIENKWFKLKLPQGWEELKVPDAPAMDGLNLMLVNKKKNCFVSFAVAPGMTSAKAAADNAVAAMRKQKIKIEDPIEENGIYRVPVMRGQAKGSAWFGSNGKDGGITTVFGDSPEAVSELFANFEPVDPAMFPRL